MEANKVLEGMPQWDGNCRFDKLGPVAFQLASCHDLETIEKRFRIMFVSAVARMMKPECKVDHLIVLSGPQGTRKSLFLLEITKPFRHVGQEWSGIRELYIDVHPNNDAVKAVALSRRNRLPYQTKPSPRDFIVVGTSNKMTFDSRCLLPIPVQLPIRLDVVAEWCSQLWAEALFRYRLGEPWCIEETAKD